MTTLTTLAPKTAEQIFHRLTNREKVTILQGQSAPGLIEHMAHSLAPEMQYPTADGTYVGFYDAGRDTSYIAIARDVMAQVAHLVNEEFRIASLNPGF